MTEPAYPEYEALRAEAEQRAARDGRFVDPADVGVRLPQVERRRGGDWVSSVLGRTYWGPGTISLVEMHLLFAADEHDVTPPLLAGIAEVRAAAQQGREEREQARQWRAAAYAAEWAALLAALSPIVAVEVHHNYKSRRHTERHIQGADHIVVKAPLAVGRLRRTAGTALCETLSTRAELYFPFAGEEQDDQLGWPTCKACIRTACKLTGVPAARLLAAPQAGYRTGAASGVAYR